jgi:proteasome assembly chaperone (PAC2) family protein
VGNLESLEAIAAFGFLADNIEDGVNELGTLGVMSLGPVVTGAGLSEDKVVGAEELSERSSTDGVHGTGLEIHKDGAGDVTATSCLVVVNVDTLELEVGITVVRTGRVNSMLVRDDFPELSSDLVTALASLDVDDFTHDVFIQIKKLL